MWFTKPSENSAESQHTDESKRNALEKMDIQTGTVHPAKSIPVNGDVAAQYAADGEIYLTPEMDKRLRMKADLYIMPIISLVYGIQYADKLIPSAAVILGLDQDLFATSATGYSWVGSSFYLGYLVFEFPMSYLMQKVKLDHYSGGLTVAWGILLACTAACSNMESFLACRVLLGMLECGIQPVFTVVVAQWYKRDETFSRTCLWFAANGLGGILGTSIGYGIAVYSENNPNYYHMEPWKMVYILMGLITIVLGFALWYILPATPHEARFLTEEEKRFQVERIRHNNQGFGTRHIKLYQIKEGLLDPRTWLYGFAELLGTVPNGGITVFSTLILTGLGYKGKDSLLMSLPSSGVELVGMLVVAVVSSYFFTKHRLFYAISGSAIGVLSLALVAWGPNNGSQLTGLYLYTISGVTAFVGFISMVESDSAGMTKKLTANAVLLICYCVGNIIGPQVFYKSESPYYPTGKRTMAATQAAQLFLVCCLALLNFYENKKRDRAGIFEPPEDFVNAEFADLTDKEMPWFRYSL